MDGRALLALHPAIDGHADTLSYHLADPAGFFAANAERHLDAPRLLATGQNIQVMAICTPPDSADPLQQALEYVRVFHAIVESPLNAPPERSFLRVLDRRSLAAACRPGAHGLLLAIEGASPLRGSFANLDAFFRLGVRLLTITHNHDTEAARGCFAEGPHRGLTPFGRELVPALGRLGMVVDVAHANPDTFAETLALARGPVIDSHTGLQAFHRASHPHLRARTISDRQLRDLAASGGVACIDFLPDHLVERGDPPRQVTRDDLIEVIRHAVEVAGIEHVGLGADWDGFGGSAVVGLEECSKLPGLVEALLAAGFPQPDVLRIVGGNLRRVFEAVLPA